VLENDSTEGGRESPIRAGDPRFVPESRRQLIHSGSDSGIPFSVNECRTEAEAISARVNERSTQEETARIMGNFR